MTTPRELHIPVTRTARYCTLGADDAGETWFVLHGYRQLARGFIRDFASLAGEGRRILAPEALSRDYTDDGSAPHGPEAQVGASWMTREDRDIEIRDYVAYLDTLAVTEGPPGVVLGFSQGAATASRWVVYGAVRPAALVLWAGLPAHDLDRSRAVARLAAVPVYVMVGSSDRYRDDEAMEEQLEWLREGGVACRVIRYDGGHRIEPEGLDALVAALRD